MNNSIILLIPILLPVVSGVIVEFFRPLKTARSQSLFFASTLGLTFVALLCAALLPDLRLDVFYVANRIPVMFKTDGPSRLFCLLSCAMFLMSGIYGCGYMKEDENRKRFYMFYLLTLGMLMGFGLSGNFITLYIFFEIMTLFSVPLVMHYSKQRNAINAAFKFLYYAILGAALALVALFVIFPRLPSLEFVPGGVLDISKNAGYRNQILAVSFLAIIGFGTKSGMFPLHGWLPDAHPVAPAPASAVLSGVITKAGIFAVFRFVYYLIGPGYIAGTWVQIAWISFSLFTILMGALLAYREPVLKRRIAYSSISQVSYIMFSLALLTPGGVTGAMLHMVVHSLVKNALFFCAGSIIHYTHKTDVKDLKGIGTSHPSIMACFILLAVTVVGIPLTGGFVSKQQILSSSILVDIGVVPRLAPVVILTSALLSAGYLLLVGIGSFFSETASTGNSDTHVSDRKADFLMKLPILLLTIACFIIGIFPGHLIEFIERCVAIIATF